MAAESARAGIVVVSYQAVDDVLRCLESCRRNASGVPVYLVDNASTDGTIDEVAARSPEVTVMAQEQNLGFGAGANVGIEAALREGREYVFLLNPDAELGAGTVEALVAFLDDHAGAAAVQPAVMLPEGRINSVGNWWHLAGFGMAGGHGLTRAGAESSLPWLRTAGAWEQGAEVPYWSGAAVLLRAEALRAAGLFAESLFLYQEDLELSLRQRLAGWTTWVLPRVEVVHRYEFGRTKDKWYYLERNRYRVLLTVLRWRTLALFSPGLLLVEIATWVRAIIEGWPLQKLRADGYWLHRSSWESVIAQRRAVFERRLLSDSELLRTASGSLPEGQLRSTALNRLGESLWNGLRAMVRW